VNKTLMLNPLLKDVQEWVPYYIWDYRIKFVSFSKTMTTTFYSSSWSDHLLYNWEEIILQLPTALPLVNTSVLTNWLNKEALTSRCDLDLCVYYVWPHSMKHNNRVTLFCLNKMHSMTKWLNVKAVLTMSLTRRK